MELALTARTVVDSEDDADAGPTAGVETCDDATAEVGTGDDGVDGVETFGGDTLGVEADGVDTEGVDTEGVETFGGDTLGVETEGVETDGVDAEGVDTGGVDTVGVETVGVETVGVETVGVETDGVETVGVETVGVDTDGVETDGVDSDDVADFSVVLPPAAGSSPRPPITVTAITPAATRGRHLRFVRGRVEAPRGSIRAPTCRSRRRPNPACLCVLNGALNHTAMRGASGNRRRECRLDYTRSTPADLRQGI